MIRRLLAYFRARRDAKRRLEYQRIVGEVFACRYRRGDRG